MKTGKWLDEHFEELLLTICLLLILAVSFLQVIIRKIPGINALTWAEEFCRFMWIFSVFLSLPYCIKRGSLLRVDILRSNLEGNAKSIFDTAVELITFLTMSGLALVSAVVVKSRFDSAELSPAMLIPMWMIYLVMLLSYVLAAVRSAQLLLGERAFSSEGQSPEGQQRRNG